MITSTPFSPSLGTRSVQMIPLEQIKIRGGSRVFAVQVPDDSLRAMGLLPNDVVICEHGVVPRSGEVVAALVDGVSVLRVWTMQGGRPVLRCPNGQTGPVNAADVVIQGVAVQMVRSREGKS